jgi:hypothetical protein
MILVHDLPYCGLSRHIKQSQPVFPATTYSQYLVAQALKNRSGFSDISSATQSAGNRQNAGIEFIAPAENESIANVTHSAASSSKVSSKKLTGRKPSLQEIIADRLFFIQPS